MPIRIRVWNEYRHEKSTPAVASIYPNGIHTTIAQGLRAMLGDQAMVSTSTQDEPEHGLTQAAVDATDVLLWWGHAGHKQVDDAIVERVHHRVLAGMGLIVLHSAHDSKIFKRLMGTGCGLRWREAGELARVWNVNPSHPITDGLGEYFELKQTEMYGEFFDVPPPESLVFVTWFAGGEIFRSGCCWTRGKGKIFYFGPGHETYPIYHDANVQRVLANASKWAAPSSSSPYISGSPNRKKPIG